MRRFLLSLAKAPRILFLCITGKCLSSANLSFQYYFLKQPFHELSSWWRRATCCPPTDCKNGSHLASDHGPARYECIFKVRKLSRLALRNSEVFNSLQEVLPWWSRVGALRTLFHIVFVSSFCTMNELSNCFGFIKGVAANLGRWVKTGEFERVAFIPKSSRLWLTGCKRFWRILKKLPRYKRRFKTGEQSIRLVIQMATTVDRLSYKGGQCKTRNTTFACRSKMTFCLYYEQNRWNKMIRNYNNNNNNSNNNRWLSVMRKAEDQAVQNVR